MTTAIRINKVAVLRDGDNISTDHAIEIDRISRGLGEVVIRRAYGNVRYILKWETMPGYHVIHSGSGKNATDILLAIDTPELALSNSIDTVLIASSNYDFTHLAVRLRERYVRVVGTGTEQASHSFRHACTHFRTLGGDQMLTGVAPALDVVKAAERTPEPLLDGRVGRSGHLPVAIPAIPSAQAVTPIDRQIRALIAANSKMKKGMSLVALANTMRMIHGVNISELNQRSWRPCFVSKPAL